jgi:hypothetical protein
LQPAASPELTKEHLMTQNTVETAEFVLPGHPDKLCDAVVDSLVDAVRRDDLGTWRRYVAAAAPVVDLARWGSQQGGMPWEKGRPAHRQTS